MSGLLPVEFLNITYLFMQLVEAELDGVVNSQVGFRFSNKLLDSIKKWKC